MVPQQPTRVCTTKPHGTTSSGGHSESNQPTLGSNVCMVRFQNPKRQVRMVRHQTYHVVQESNGAEMVGNVEVHCQITQQWEPTGEYNNNVQYTQQETKVLRIVLGAGSTGTGNQGLFHRMKSLAGVHQGGRIIRITELSGICMSTIHQNE